LVHFGVDDYTEMENTLQNDRLPSKALEATGWYTCVSDIHGKMGAKKLVFGKENESWFAGAGAAFRFSGIHQEDVGTLLRVR